MEKLATEEQERARQRRLKAQGLEDTEAKPT